MSQEIIQVEEIKSEIAIIPSTSEVDIQIQTAKKYPRNIQNVKSELLIYAASDEDTAKSCFYYKPVGEVSTGKQTFAEGPSIRLAEIVVSCFGNIRVSNRVSEISDKRITVEAVCHDLEKNNAVKVEVSKSIIYKNGNRYKEDLITTTINAATAIAIRNAVFKVVPVALIKPELDKIKRKSTGEGKLEDRAKKSIDYFKKQGITEVQIFKTLDIKDMSEFTEEHLIQLTGIFNAIKDKETTLIDAFGVNLQDKVTGVENEVKDIIGKK